jgi:hypothetical protein
LQPRQAGPIFFSSAHVFLFIEHVLLYTCLTHFGTYCLTTSVWHFRRYFSLVFPFSFRIP